MMDILNTLMDIYFNDIVTTTQELVRINSVLDESTACRKAPFGVGVRRAMDYVINKANSLGLETQDIDGHAVTVDLGESTDEPVGILAHLDTVQMDGRWNYPPLEANIVDGKLYGRGSSDDKGPLVACLYALKAIREAGIPFKKRARLFCGGDEETQSRCIKYYLQQGGTFSCGFSPDSRFPIIVAEKGILHASFIKTVDTTNSIVKQICAGTSINVVPNAAEAILDIKARRQAVEIAAGNEFFQDIHMQMDSHFILAKAHGVAAHAGEPSNGKNAIQVLLAFLSRLHHDDDMVLDAIRYWEGLTRMEVGGESMGVSCADELSGSLTNNVAILRLKDKKIEIKLDIRYPVTCNWDNIQNSLQAVAGHGGFTYSLLKHTAPIYLEKDSPILKNLIRAYEECTEQKAFLRAIGGGTYCRNLNNFVAFGPVFPDKPFLAHKANEYIELDDLRLAAKIYAQAIYNLII